MAASRQKDPPVIDRTSAQRRAGHSGPPDADVLYEAGCAGVQRAVFDREAASFAAAVASAITAIESSIPGARVTAAGRLGPAEAPLPRPA
jgi:hypothetical protein